MATAEFFHARAGTGLAKRRSVMNKKTGKLKPPRETLNDSMRVCRTMPVAGERGDEAVDPVAPPCPCC